jgi:hypothetical protein
MDISALKQRLASLQNPKGQKKELSQDLWRPTVGKHTIRIVPSKFEKSITRPYTEMRIHYGINGKMMSSPLNYGEKDPIVEFATKLRSTNDWQSAKKLEPKLRIFVPVIVRGEEDRGVRLWEFGKKTYEELLKYAEDEDIGNYTDVVEGRDFVVETQDKATTGLMYNTSTVRISVKVTPLSKEANLVEKWLNEQPDPKALFKRWTYDEMKDALAAHLNPEEEVKDNANNVEEEERPQEKKTFSLNTSKSVVDDNFDDLFNLNG